MSNNLSRWDKCKGGLKKDSDLSQSPQQFSPTVQVPCSSKLISRRHMEAFLSIQKSGNTGLSKWKQQDNFGETPRMSKNKTKTREKVLWLPVLLLRLLWPPLPLQLLLLPIRFIKLSTLTCQAREHTPVKNFTKLLRWIIRVFKLKKKKKGIHGGCVN